MFNRYTAVCLVISCANLCAQSYFGGVRGAVSDAGAGAMADVKVTLIDEATNISRSALTNAQGEYVFSAVNPANYTLSAESPGFKKFQNKGIVVGTQQFVTIDFKLELGQVTESVQVTEEAPLMETSNASTGQVVDRQKLIDLPNLGRNPFMMARIAPNVVQAGDPRFNRMQDQSGSSQISIAGGPVRGNNYLLDGVPITDAQNRAIIIPTVESVGEVKIQANTYDAEMGRTGGGVFNAYLKSGSNTLHGSAFGYMRQPEWLANDFFNNRNGIARPNTPFKNYGGSFGGPIRIPKIYDGRNKTFFWTGGEAYRQKSSASQEFATPTAAQRAGDFSAAVTSRGVQQTIYDPLSTRSNGAGGFIRDPFVGNVIPANRINPVGAAIVQFFPQPTKVATYLGQNNLIATPILQDRADQLTFKVDHELRPWWKASASYLHYGSREPAETWFGTIASTSATMLYRKVDATQVSNLFTPSPTMVVNVRYGFNRFPNVTRLISDGFNPATLGFPNSFVKDIQALRFPHIAMQTFHSLSDSAGGSEVYDSRNFLASVAKYFGRHSIKAGFDFRRINVDFLSYGSSATQNPAGIFTFNDGFTRRNPLQGGDGTGSDLASLLLGYPADGSALTGTKLFTFVNYYAGYVHDDFRLNSKLTLNFGLRYEWETGLAERSNQLVVGFDRTVTSPLASQVTGISPKGGVLYAGLNGNPTACCDPNKAKFAPRFGAAYTLDSKTTIRGGYGMFYAPLRYDTSTDIALGYYQSTPFIASNDGGVTPSGSLSNPYPNGLLKPVGNSLGLLAGIGQTFGFFDQDRGSPVVHQFSFDVQREFRGGLVVSAGYVGSVSRHLPPSGTTLGGYNINQIPDSFFSLGTAGLAQSVDNPFFGNGGAGVVAPARVSRAQLLKPFPQFNTIRAFTDASRARYDSLVVKGQKRFSSGLTFLGAWTWSKNMDSSFATASTLNERREFPQNGYDIDAEYSLSLVQTPHRFSGSFSYDLPFGKGKAMLSNSKLLDYAVGGWQLNAVTVMQTGFPLAVRQDQNLNSIIGAETQRPNATGIAPATGGALGSRLDGYFNPGAFSQAPALTFGNTSRTLSYRGPGTANWDFSLFKTVSILERFKAQFRAEALNAFNTPLFRGPNIQYGNANFGKITRQANFARYIQLGVRFYF